MGNADDRNPIFYHPDVQFFAPYVDPPAVAAARMSHSQPQTGQCALPTLQRP
ncbi:MAG: hypothetical protein R3A44_44585 [Caldilineaceae bacterium]